MVVQLRYPVGQMGYGDLPGYRGSRYQRGYGIGSLLGSLFRAATPLLKSGAKALVKQGARFGTEVVSDVIEGRNIKEAARERGAQVARRVGRKAVGKVRRAVAPPPRPFRRYRKKRPVIRRGRAGRVGRVHPGENF